MIRRLAATLAFLLAPAIAQAQYVPLFAAALAPSPRAEQMAAQYGGLSLDFTNGRFYYVPSAGGTPVLYSSLSSLVTALGGTISLPAKNCYNASGYLATTTANTPTICYDGLGQNAGQWIEGARTNNASYPEDLTNAAWTATGIVAVNNGAKDPRGGTAATTLRENSSTGNHWAIQTYTKAAAAQNRVLSAWAYQRNGDRCFGLYADDNAGNGVYAIFQTDQASDNPNALTTVVGPIAFGTGFSTLTTFAEGSSKGPARFGLAYATNTATTLRIATAVSDCTSLSYTGDNLSSIAVWGVQSEQYTAGATEMARYPTSYVNPSRAADSVIINVPSAWASSSAWTLQTQLMQPGATPGASNYWLTVDDNTTSTNKVTLFKGSTGYQTGQVYAAGSQTMSRSATKTPYGAVTAMICSFSASNGYACKDNFGQSAQAAAGFTMPSGLTKIHLGHSTTSLFFPADGRFQKVGIFPAQLPTSNIQTLMMPTVVGPYDTVDQPNALGPNSINSVHPTVGATFYVSQQGVPPASNSVGASSCTTTTPGCWQTLASSLFPMSLASSQNIKGLVASNWTGSTAATSCNPACPIAGEHFVWGNHPPRVGTTADVPNPTYPTITSSSGLVCRPIYSSVATSDAATAAPIAYSAGWAATESGGNAGKGYLDITRAAGIPDAQVMSIDTFATLAANSATDPCTGTSGSYVGTFSTAQDYVLLPQARLVDATIPMRGFRLDAEFFDGRSPSQVTALYTQLLGLIQPAKNGTTYKLSTYHDNLTTGIAQYTGITSANICTLLGMGAEMSVTAQGGNPQNNVLASVQAQVQFVVNACGSFPYDKHRLIFRFANYPSGTTVADAQAINAELQAHPWAGLELQKFYSVFGGTCDRYTTQRLAAVAGISGCP